MKKTCTKCGVEKPQDEFYRDKNGKQGRRADCKVCTRATVKDYYERNAEEKRAYQRRYNEEQASAIRRARRQRYLANPEPYKEAARRWSRENPERRRSIVERRRARLRDAPCDDHSLEELLESWEERDFYGCVWCGGPYEHLDHVIPLSLGGGHTVGNLVPSCATCNISKNDRPLDVWLEVLNTRP